MVPGAAAGRAADRSGAWRWPEFRLRRRWVFGALLSAAVTFVSVVAILRRGERGAADEARSAACAAKARTNLAKGDPRDALHWAELAVALDPASAAAQRLAGGARAALGDMARAFDRLEAAADAAPDDAEAALSAGLAARLLARHGGGPSYDERARRWLGSAIARADRAAARCGDASVPRSVAAAACIALKDPDAAIARLGGVHPRDASEAEQVAVLRAAAEAVAGRPDVALKSLDEAIGAAASPAAVAARARLTELCAVHRGTLRERALRCLAAAKPDDAVAKLSEWLQEHRGDAIGLAGLAAALQAAGRRAEAEGVRAAILRDGGPRSFDAATWFWAHVRRAAGDPGGALDCLEALRSRDPGNEAVLAALVTCADEAGDPSAGLAAAEASARLAPRSAGIAALLGVARERAGDVDGAIDAYQSAIRLDATDAQVVGPSVTAAPARPTTTCGARRNSAARRIAADHLADLLLRTGRAEESLAALDAVRAPGDRGEATVRRARALLAAGRVTDADAEFRAVAAADPDCAAAHVGLAQTAWLRGDAATTRAALDTALGADPESVDAWTTLFATARRAEESAPHDARLAAAIVARPRSAALLFVAGVVAERRGEFDAAARQYRASLAIAPRSVHARNNLAWVLATSLGRPAEARRIADGALADAPTSPQVLDTAGWARFLDGDAAGAEPLLARARRASPRNGAVALRHARALAAVGRTGEAAAAIDEAVGADPALRGTPAHEAALAAVSLVPATATPALGPNPSGSEVPR